MEGRYDDLCEAAFKKSDGELVALIVIEGRKGTGFSVTVRHPMLLRSLPALLRAMADDIEGQQAAEVQS